MKRFRYSVFSVKQEACGQLTECPRSERSVFLNTENGTLKTPPAPHSCSPVCIISRSRLIPVCNRKPTFETLCPVMSAISW